MFECFIMNKKKYTHSEKVIIVFLNKQKKFFVAKLTVLYEPYRRNMENENSRKTMLKKLEKTKLSKNWKIRFKTEITQ